MLNRKIRAKTVYYSLPDRPMFQMFFDDDQRSVEILRGTVCALLSEGINPDSMGFEYLTEAVAELCQKDGQMPMMQVYEKIAENCGKNVESIERSIRYAISRALLHRPASQDYLTDGYLSYGSGGISNSDFVKIVADGVRKRLEYFDMR